MELVIENLKVKLQKEEILHGINLKIEDGSFVSLLGASGCGKTTLLKSIAGLLKTESGDILMAEESIVKMLPEKRGTVIVFQDLRLFPHMTVEQNIRFPMELQKISKQQQEETVTRLLEDVRLAGFEKRKICQLSGGQRQRVALARALAANPKILLLDEPFSGLDEKLRLEMGDLIKRLHKEWGITTVLVTHDKREALQMSDKIALMSQGSVLQYDTPENIFYHPVSKEVADYFGKANYIEGTIENGVFQSNDGMVEIKSVQEQKAIMGKMQAMIRPFLVKLEKVDKTHKVDKIDKRNSTRVDHLQNKSAGRGKITDISFMGDMVEVTVETKKGSVLSLIRYEELVERGLKRGCEVNLVIGEEHIVFFEI